MAHSHSVIYRRHGILKSTDLGKYEYAWVIQNAETGIRVIGDTAQLKTPCYLYERLCI